MKGQKRALRVAFIAGTLGHGGAERQMTHMIRALRISGVEVRVCCLTEGEHYERILREEGVVVECVGRHSNPALRLVAIVTSLRRFKPHVLQAVQSFVNLHAALPARALGAVSLGALRCDLELSSKDNGNWIRWLMRVPDGVVVNSQVVRNQLVDSGILKAARVHYLANRVDLSYYDVTPIPHNRVNVLFVGRLVQSKRLDCFLRALAIARRSAPSLAGLIVGDGPERASAELLARELKLFPDHVRFAGFTDRLPDWLAQSDILLMCSESEGSANVLLEAMAARLPVVTTPAGDAEHTVRHNHTAFLVPYGDAAQMASHLVELAQSPALRRQMGEAGRAQVCSRFALTGLAESLTKIYSTVARRRRREDFEVISPETLKVLARSGGAGQ